MAINFDQLSAKLKESYLQAAGQAGKVNTDETSIMDVKSNATEALIYESDGDILYTTLDENDEAITRLVTSEEAQALLNANFSADDANSIDFGTEDAAQPATVAAEPATTAVTDAAAVQAAETTTVADTSEVAEEKPVIEHRAGTGSSMDRVNTLQNSVGNIPNASSFKDSQGNISREKIQNWLDTNNHSASDSVDGGFNVDDVLAYYSANSEDEDKIYYHLLANESWLDKGATGNNTVDGKISQQEIDNFYNDRFGTDIKDDIPVTRSSVESWKEANNAVGSSFHDGFSYNDIIALQNKYNPEILDEDNNNGNNNTWNQGDHKYEDYQISASNLDTTKGVENVLDTLQSSGDFEATMEMKEDVKLKDLNTNRYVTLEDGETYDITKITDKYVSIEDDDDVYKFARGDEKGDFEYATKGNIDNIEYSSDKKISSSTAPDKDKNDGEYKYEDKKLDSESFTSSSNVKKVLDELQDSDDFEATIKMDDDVRLYDTNEKEYVTLSDGRKYEIEKISDGYVYLDVNGETIKVARGTSGNGIEAKLANNIQSMTYSSDDRIAAGAGATSSAKLTFANYSADKIENTMDNLAQADDYEAYITIKNKNWFNEDHTTFLPVGEYQITKVTDRYVELENEDGETIRIRRGTDEYEFEWYCSKENKGGSTTGYEAYIYD